MIKVLSILTFVFGANCLYGQTQSKFYCKADSIAYYKIRKLADDGIQNIMSFHYSYNNGRVPGEFYCIFWQDSSNGHFIKIGCCDQPCIRDTSALVIRELFNYYEQTQIDTMTTEIESMVSMSHDMGYTISVYYPGKTKRYNIRDHQRGVGMIRIDGKRVDGKETFPLKDPRIIWLNKAEALAKQFD